MTPVFADNVICNATPSGNNTIITCPNFPQSQPATAPYYINPQPSTSFTKDLVNTFFNKLSQATVQLSGPNANDVQNVTSAVKQVVDSSIDYVYALKYLVASLLGIIVPKIFGLAVPSWLLPLMELISLGFIIYGIWRKGWEIILTALVIGIVILLVFYLGGVVFH